MRIFLIDGQSYIYRAFYAVQDLTNSSGFPTNAIFGFVNMLKRVRETYDPSHLAIIFDAPGKNFRHERYRDYKANRQSMPDPLRQQIPRIKEVVQAYRIPAIELTGYEADDILAEEHQKKEALFGPKQYRVAELGGLLAMSQAVLDQSETALAGFRASVPILLQRSRAVVTASGGVLHDQRSQCQ